MSPRLRPGVMFKTSEESYMLNKKTILIVVGAVAGLAAAVGTVCAVRVNKRRRAVEAVLKAPRPARVFVFENRKTQAGN